MKRVVTREGTGADSACRHLAVRVIEQAVRDLSGAGASPADRESARGFLSGSEMFHRWCELANLDASWMVGRAATLVARSGPLSIDTILTPPRTRPLSASKRESAVVRLQEVEGFDDGSAADGAVDASQETAASARVSVVRARS